MGLLTLRKYGLFTLLESVKVENKLTFARSHIFQVNRQIMEQKLIKSLETCGCTRTCWLTAHEVKQQQCVSEEHSQMNGLTSGEYPIRLTELKSIPD